MQDYGGPVGLRKALAHPARIDTLIVQDTVAHNCVARSIDVELGADAADECRPTAFGRQHPGQK
jgi:hypothetical protein